MTGKSARRMTITKGKRLYVRSDKIQAFLFNAKTTSALLIHFLTLQRSLTIGGQVASDMRSIHELCAHWQINSMSPFPKGRKF